MRKRNDIQEGDVALPPFDSADVIAVQACQFRKLLLRETPLEPKLAKLDSE
jgi:hypothetical protein